MRILIVGAGIAGLSSAWALAKAGHEIVLFEQDTIPNPLGASGDHHRIIRRAYGPESGYAGAIDEAYEAWGELWNDLGERHYDHRGFMAVSREKGDEAEIYLSGLEAGAFPYEFYEPAEACERWLFLESGTFRYAFFSREGGALHCRAIAAALATWLSTAGVEVSTHTKIASVDPDTASVMLYDGTLITGDVVIVAAGAWTTKLFPHLARHLTAKRTAVAYLEPPPDLSDSWKRAPVILDVGGKTDGYIIPPTGGAGLKFGSGLHKRTNPDADADRTARPGEGMEIRNLFSPPIARIDEYRVVETVTCAYTFTADERFFCKVIGNVLVISACSGHGYKFGAAVGRRVSKWAEDRDTVALHNWLRAETLQSRN
jgi:sarcosine oxidase